MDPNTTIIAAKLVTAEEAAAPRPVAAVDPATVEPLDPDREPVRSKGAEFVVVACKFSTFDRGDRIKRSDFSPHADVKKLLSGPLPALAPIPGVDVSAHLDPKPAK